MIRALVVTAMVLILALLLSPHDSTPPPPVLEKTVDVAEEQELERLYIGRGFPFLFVGMDADAALALAAREFDTPAYTMMPGQQGELVVLMFDSADMWRAAVVMGFDEEDLLLWARRLIEVGRHP